MKETVKEIVLIAPLAVYVPRKTMEDRRYLVNMNNYRNWQGHENNNIKKAFQEAVRDQLENIIIEPPVEVEFTLYKGSKRKTDKSNFYAVLSKFLFDSMTNLGCWEDDNDDFIKTEIQHPTEIDRENPRGVFLIRSIK